MESIEAGWRQHFVSFAKAFLFFKECVEKPSYSPIEVGGLVHVFESTFELGWKTIKDFLFEQGLPAAFPRAAIKEGFNPDFAIGLSCKTQWQVCIFNK